MGKTEARRARLETGNQGWASQNRRPLGEKTRGKTRENRLRGVDNFLLGYDPLLITRNDGLFRRAFFVDLGYGEDPVTTLESASRLRRLNPELPVLGVEIDPERVTRAQPFATPMTQFRLGGFNLPLQTWPDSGEPEGVRLIRAFNVLRQYEEAAVPTAWAGLGRALVPGGLLVEGTSDPYGRLWTANLLRKPRQGGDSAPLVLEALVLAQRLRLDWAPEALQAVLPKNLIHRMRTGEPIHDFIIAWRRAWEETRALGQWGNRQWFVAAAQRLHAMGHDVSLRPRWLNQGWLVWQRPPPALYPGAPPAPG